MWIENDVLNHFFQISWGSGWNSRSVDNTGYLFEIDLNSVNQVFFDKETKRVEFLALGKGNHYADIATGRIDKQWDLKQGYKCILYDYYEPSIVKSLSEKGIATVYKGNIIKNLIMDCQSYTKYRPNETTGGIFVSWRRKEELPTGA